jgi:hypothetical protein
MSEVKYRYNIMFETTLFPENMGGRFDTLKDLPLEMLQELMADNAVNILENELKVMNEGYTWAKLDVVGNVSNFEKVS